MHSILSSVLITLLAATNVGAQVARDTQADAVKEIGRLIRERLDAYGRADAIAWSRFVADDCLCATSTKAALQREIATRLSNVKNWLGDIVDLEVHVYGDTAVARYRVTEYSELAGQRISFQVWRNETHVRRGGVWRLVAGGESEIPQDPAVAKVDPKVYDAYVGQYEYAPGVIDTVIREGDHLLVQVTGQGKEEVFPENETTYFGKQQNWRMIFVKDEQGRVTSVRFRQHGQDFIARKIR
jgi:ketosteroid isomerase-like protein